MQKASKLHEGGIYAIGNAPTALLELIRLIKEGLAKPDLVIGMPVGFVSAAESKEESLKLEGIPYITNVGRKGGSTVTFALNAISLLADEQAKNNGAEAKKDPKDMRHGYTTGACATAVSKAHCLPLLPRRSKRQVRFIYLLVEMQPLQLKNAYLKKMLSAVRRLKMLVMILMRPIRHSSLAQ